jgi:biopolymer transport protein TolR
MGMAVGEGGGLNSEINVTPLVDVVLVLLIIFMVIVPLSQMGYDIEIPRESMNAVPPEQSDKQVILAVSESDCAIAAPLTSPGLPPGCRVRINKEEVLAEDLSKRMGEIFGNRRKADKVLFLAAEEKLNYEGVIRLLDLAKNGAGEDLKVGIVTDERLATNPQ